MKRTLLILMVVGTFCSCSSNSSKTTTEDKKMEVGVENVNGNIPDTTNAINLSSQKKDTTTQKDSVTRK